MRTTGDDSYLNGMLRKISILVFIGILALSTSAVFSADAAEAGGEKQGKGTYTLKLIGTEIEIPEQYRIPIVIGVVLLALFSYAPKGFGELRDLVGRGKATKDALQLEKMKLENLKLRYDIEVLKKTHGVAVDEGEEQRGQAEALSAPEAPASPRMEEVKTIVKAQIDDVEQRERFFFRRVAAFFIDYFFAAFAFGIFVAIISLVWPSFGEPVEQDIIAETSVSQDTLYQWVLWISLVVYFVGMWVARGATVGLMVLGLRIVRLDRRPISVKDALIRFVVFVLLNIIAFVWLLWDANKQSLADKASGTIVVKVRGRLATDHL